MIDKVKKILRELLNEQPKYISYDKGYSINLEPFAVQICRLLSKSADNPDELKPDRPKIVCLCGSTRFVDYYNEYRKKFTLEGYIVLAIELVIQQAEADDPQHSNYTMKQMLDELHLRKIDLADEVFILNVGGYIGDSTRREIDYATEHGKPIKYLEA